MYLDNCGSFIKSLCLLALAAAAFPTGLVNAIIAPASGSTVKLEWNAVAEPNLQGYRLFVGTQSGQYTQTYDTGMATLFPVTDLQPGQTYFFAVIAIGSTGLESLPSDELAVTVATPPVIPPGATMTLGWNAVSNSDLQGYRVYVGTASGQYTRSHDTGTALSLPIDNLTMGQTYYFAVIAINSTGLESEPSNELRVTIALPPLPAASTLTSNAAGSLSLQWTIPNSAMGSSPQFLVQASADLRNWLPVATVLATDAVGSDAQSTRFSWPIPVPAAGAGLFYRLTARNWLGTSTAP